MKDIGEKPEIPECEDGADLVQAMMALPPTRPMAMGGHRAADWPEIWAFIQATGRRYSQWEVEALHEMCGAFSDGFRRVNPLAKSPVEMEREKEA